MLVMFDSKTEKPKRDKKCSSDNKTKETSEGSLINANDTIRMVNNNLSSTASISPTDDRHRISKNPPNRSLSTKKTLQYVVSTDDDFSNMAFVKRSKKGCLTCKVRKKKCDEAKPSCSECSRLHKDCVWVGENMSKQEIRDFKQQVALGEQARKLRRRRPVVKDPQLHSTCVSRSTKSNNHNFDKPMSNGADSNVDKLQGTLPGSEPSEISSSFLYEPSASVFQKVSNDSKIIDDESIERQKITANNVDINSFRDIKDESLVQVEDYGDKIEKNNKEESISRVNSFTSLFKDVLLEQFQNSYVNMHPDSPEDNKSPTLSTYFNFVKEMTAQKNVKLINSESVDECVDEHEIISAASPNMHSLENSLSPNFNQYLFGFADPIFTTPSTLPELSGTGYHLYNYYVQTVSKMISVSPTSQDDSNSFEKVLLPFAHRDKGVLYALLAWAGYCMGGTWVDEGKQYIQRAIHHLNSLNGNKCDRETTLFKLATLLVLCGAEIFNGDVSNWSVYLSWSWKILCQNGGIVNFNRSREENFLVCNFAYHDILTSSSERGTYFPSIDYESIFHDNHKFSKGKLDPLLGASKKLYKILGDISTLVFESKRILKTYYEGSTPTEGILSEVGFSEEYEDYNEDDILYAKNGKLLCSVLAKCKELELEIDNAKPNPLDLVNLTDEELELQLTMFEALQLTAKLFIRQAIKRENPSSLESQMLNNDLLKCIDITISTQVQASFVFPVFMAGIHCVTEKARIEMKERVERFKHCYGGANVKRAQSLMEEVWKENPNGNKVVDWHLILKRLNWHMNFA